MSTDAKSALDPHEAMACPIPPVQIATSIFRCTCGRAWHSDGYSWITNINGIPVKRVPAPKAETRRNPHCANCGDLRGGPMGHETSECTWKAPGRIVGVVVDRIVLHTANGWAQWLVHSPTGEDWTLTLTGLRIEPGNHLAPRSDS